MKLRYFLISVFITLAFAPIAVLIAWPQSRILENEFDEVNERHLLIAESLASDLEHYHKSLRGTFELLIRNAGVLSDTPSVHRVLDDLYIQHICIVNGATAELETSIKATKAPDCPAIIPAERMAKFRDIATPGQTVFSGVSHRPDGRILLYMVHSLGAKMAIGAVGTQFFVKIGDSIRFGEDGHAEIVDQFGNLLSHPQKGWVSARRNIADLSPVERIMQGESGVDVFFSDPLGGNVIAGFSTVAPVGWGVMVPQPVAELKAKANEARTSVMVVLLFGAAIALGLAVWISVITARPLEWISAQTKRISGGDLSMPPKIKTPFMLPTELKLAQRNVRDMIRRLRHNMFNINRLAYFDPVTGLANRTYFKHRLTQFMHTEDETPIGSLLFLDLDGFKEVNDNFGHDLGDTILSQVADRICVTCAVKRDANISNPLENIWVDADGPIVARLGGDEFGIFMPHSTSAQAERLAEKILWDLAHPFRLDVRRVTLGGSIGIATTPNDAQDVASLLKAGDLAMYEAKSRGKGQIAHFLPEILAAAHRQQNLAKELKEALHSNEIEPHFQPQYDAVTREFAGVEALARWRHPERGLLLPADFLPIADQLGLTEKIDRIILHKSIAAMQHLSQIGIEVPSLSVNLSAARLADPLLIPDVQILPKLPFKLNFELLETVFLDRVDNKTAATVKQLVDYGIGIELDDFGSGHASIVALLSLRPDTLKIDRNLVGDIVEDAHRLSLVRAIIEMGSALGISITAEGVETEGQADLLASIGCHTLQGRALAYPMDQAELEAHLQRPVLAVETAAPT
jgi:diguanylate cyclase (GGDEF)-like protein